MEKFRFIRVPLCFHQGNNFFLLLGAYFEENSCHINQKITLLNPQQHPSFFAIKLN